MKFAARDGSAARTLAHTSPRAVNAPGLFAAPGWRATTDSSVAEHPSIAPSPSTDGHLRGAGQGAGTRSHRRPAATFLRGQEIFTPGQGKNLVYIVRTGCVRLYKVLPDGRSINLGLLGPNTIFTQEDMADGTASGAIAEALVETTVSIVETEDLAWVVAESPDLAAAVVTGMTRRLTELQTLVEQLLVRDTAVRLATTLLSLARRFGRPTADGLVAITLPLTHQAIAGMIGSNRVTVTRKLLELQERGFVRSIGRNALAVDPDQLRDYARAAGETATT